VKRSQKLVQVHKLVIQSPSYLSLETITEKCVLQGASHVVATSNHCLSLNTQEQD